MQTVIKRTRIYSCAEYIKTLLWDQWTRSPVT